MASSNMTKVGVFALGGSAGGLAAVRAIASTLPPDFPAALCVVLHVSPNSPGLLPELIAANGPLPAQHAREGETIRGGRFFVAPPDRHFIVTREGAVRLGVGPKENMFRPAIDPLFRSVASAFGRSSAGVVLSGGLDDGVAGLATIKDAGGLAIVQDPDDAEVPSMPRAALRRIDVDHCLELASIGPCLAQLARSPSIQGSPEVNRSTDIETEIADGADARKAGVEQLGKPSIFACPHCHGVLLQLEEPPLRFRCHTGHAYTLETLAHALGLSADSALWIALRALQERDMILEKLAELDDGGELASKEKEVRDLAGQLRRLIVGRT